MELAAVEFNDNPFTDDDVHPISADPDLLPDIDADASNSKDEKRFESAPRFPARGAELDPGSSIQPAYERRERRGPKYSLLQGRFDENERGLDTLALHRVEERVLRSAYHSGILEMGGDVEIIRPVDDLTTDFEPAAVIRGIAQLTGAPMHGNVRSRVVRRDPKPPVPRRTETRGETTDSRGLKKLGMEAGKRVPTLPSAPQFAGTEGVCKHSPAEAKGVELVCCGQPAESTNRRLKSGHASTVARAPASHVECCTSVKSDGPGPAVHEWTQYQIKEPA